MSRTPVRSILLAVGPPDEGLRLDRFLRNRSHVLSRVRARDLLASGRVRVNGQPAEATSRILRAGDRVEVFPDREKGLPDPPVGEKPFRIVHEDRAVLVVDKAPGILVQPTAERRRGALTQILAEHLAHRHPGRRPYLGLLHRIDRDTSGLLLFSRRGSANRILAEQFRLHTITREYLAVVRGEIPGETGSITDRLGRLAPGSRRSIAKTPGRGRPAVTRFRVLGRFGSATLVRVSLETGRTHQIRVHFAERGHPVVGDRVYGTGLFPPDPLIDSFPRQALHAERLGFTHPETGRQLDFRSPLPEDLKNLVDRLQARAEKGGRGRRILPPVGRKRTSGESWSQGASATTGFVRVPIPSTVTSAVSPSTRGPIPDGVPVAIRSPGSSVMTRDT